MLTECYRMLQVLPDRWVIPISTGVWLHSDQGASAQPADDFFASDLRKEIVSEQIGISRVTLF